MYISNENFKQLQDLAKIIEENHRQLMEQTENTVNGVLISVSNAQLISKSIEDSIKYHQLWFEQQQKLLTDQMNMFR